MKEIYKYLFLILCPIACVVLASCVSEVLDPDKGKQDPTKEEGYFLSFKMNLARLTREGSEDFEKYEDYIKPESLQLLFFYADESKKDDEYSLYHTLFKKFNFQDFSLVPVESTGSEMAQEWYIRIPITGGHEDFAEILRNNDFKIAVIANWPNLPSGGLVEEIRDQNGNITERGSNISKLHHLSGTDEAYYKESKSRETYGFLYDYAKDGGVMGLYTGWVDDEYSDEGEAATDIINILGPSVVLKSQTDKHGNAIYGDLWLRWNFADAYSYLSETERGDDYSYSPSLGTNKFADVWAKKNADELGEWLKGANSSEDSDTSSEESDTSSEEPQALEDLDGIKDNLGQPVDDGNFRFIGGSSYFDEEEKGICLKRGTVDFDHNTFSDIIKFNVPNSGTIKITWGSTDGENAAIRVERRNHDNDSQAKKESDDFPDGYIDKTASKITSTHSYDITGDAEIIFLYAVTDNVIIYEIEHVADRYLYYVSRSGRELNKTSQLIPMYGIQKFPKIEATNWPKGTAFDLSNFNNLGTGNYTPKDIHLIRSLAKVVLEIPKTLKAHHVYLRSMNRNARCEPMDVSTPTNEIWKDHILSSTDDHSQECEWFRLIGHIPFYEIINNGNNDNNKDKTVQLQNYKSKLAWYYGTWADDDGKVGGVVPNPSNISDSPHILNPMINRTDFTEFIENGSDSYYDRYVLYVPEKFVDDPNSIGSGNNMERGAPKVCHIEFRESGDPVTNIDDNNCYRIYFTTGGFQTIPGEDFPYDGNKTAHPGDRDHLWENCYEQNVENLRKHWPIMRNHVYKFTVIDNDRRVVITKLEVLPWSMVEENNDYQW